jgi:ribose 5-phosphate isomerase B
MKTPIDIDSLVKRVVGRVMAERGRARHASTNAEVPGVERPAGVFVSVESRGEPARPMEGVAAKKPARGADLVTAEMLAKIERGGSFRVPSGAIVTDLARDEAWRRGIRLEDRATTDSGRLRIAIAADHGGFSLKSDVIDWVRALGHETFDLGTRDESPVDYPDFARAVAESVARSNADLGIAIDGAGIGSAMAANKVVGVRAANCWDAASAKNAREHNFANVLTLGAKMLPREKLYEIVRTFLTTPTGEERHARRVKKITDIERAYSRAEERERK